MKNKSTILVVDDEPDARRNLEVLFIQSYHLAFATSANEALRKASEIVPDLILLDTTLPGPDGFDACRQLRALPVVADIPIILLLPLDDLLSRLKGIEAGADEVVGKSASHTELRARVRAITQLNRFGSLRAERARSRWLMEQSSDGYVLLNSHGEILYANAQARLYLGLPQKDVLPPHETFLTLARKQYLSEPPEAWLLWPGRASLSYKAPRYLVRPETAAARAFWLQVEMYDPAQNADDDWLVVLRDVTAQMVLQADLRKFHSSIRHKLRSPFVVMQTSLQLLAHHADKLSQAEIVEIAEGAIKGIARLQGEVEDVLHYMTTPSLAQPGAGFPLAQLQGILTTISSDLGLAPVRVALADELIKAKLALTSEAVEVILREILENSKKFHPTGAPQVEIQVEWFNAKEARLQIRDDGLTLSPEQLAQAWTPYYQGEKNFSGEMPGMGLGLSLVAALLWEVGGRYQLHNRENGPGIVVELRFPLAQ
jgi:two-component system cell cycle response regulator